MAKELKKQTSVAEKQHQKLDKIWQQKKVYDKDFTFYKYGNTKDFAAKRYFDSKQNDLKEFKNISKLFYHDTINVKKLNQIMKIG